MADGKLRAAIGKKYQSLGCMIADLKAVAIAVMSVNAYRNTTDSCMRPFETDWELDRIVFVTSEVAPFSKTGGHFQYEYDLSCCAQCCGWLIATGRLARASAEGLGEAMDGLPIALAALGHRCMVISPRPSQHVAHGQEASRKVEKFVCWRFFADVNVGAVRLRPVQGGVGHRLLELPADGWQE